MLFVGAKYDWWKIRCILHESGACHLVSDELCLSVRLFNSFPLLFGKQILNSRDTKQEEVKKKKKDDNSKSDIIGEDYIQERVNQVLFSAPDHKRKSKEDDKKDIKDDNSKSDINGEDYIQDRVNAVLFSSPGHIK